jgi:hypothetical protein
MKINISIKKLIENQYAQTIKYLMRNRILFKSAKLVHNSYWQLIMQLWKFWPKKTGNSRTNTKYSIGIVTYVDRYERFFKPLITNSITLFPDTEFVIAVNGFYDQKIQTAYLNDIKIFLSKFKNIKIIDFMDPQSLSKLWNLLILNSSCNKTIIFNDDVKMSISFRKNLEISGFLNEEIALMNRSWSHFIISKSIVREIGWFDQRFPGVGNEDEDYECRLVINNIIIPTFRIYGLKNVSFITRNFSYGKDITTVQTKYVKQNKVFFDSKWLLSNVERDDFRFVEILNLGVKLRDGMETPNFYELNLLDNTNINIIK